MNRIALVTLIFVTLAIFGCSDRPSAPTTADFVDASSTLNNMGWPDNMSGESVNPSYADAKYFPSDSLWKYDVVLVTIVWGNPLPNATPTAAPTIDWQGRLWINGVVYLDPRMLISFEKGQDTLIVSDSMPPIRWLSTTNGDIDGLTFAMYIDKTVMYVVEPELRFETAQGNLKWSLSRLYHFDSLYVLNNTNIVAIHSQQVKQPCLQGLMTGLWVKEDAAHGTYQGVWGGPVSNVQGRLHGKFWTTDDGKRILDGFWESPGSGVTGVIKGRWEYFDPTMCPLCGQGHGFFMGTVTFPAATLTPIRLVGEFGHFGAISDSLPFRGRWEVICNTSTIGSGE